MAETTVVQYSRIGGPEVLEFATLPLADPSAGEVVVEVLAIGVNPIDGKLRSGLRPTPPITTPRRVIGIDASAKIDETRAQVERIARNTARLIGLERELRDDEITVLEGWAGDLYGIPVQSTLDAIRLTGSLEGMIIDPVYEGKSMAGLIDLVTSGDIPRDSNVLYAHLGGQPAINAYHSLWPAQG